MARRRARNWQHWAAPTAFLAVATIAIVLVASSLRGPTTSRSTTALLPTTTSAKQPARSTTAKTTTHGKRTYYTVVAGDSFGAIASKTGTSVAELERLNQGVSSTSLHVGEKLRVA